MRWKNVRIIYTAWSVQIRSYFWSVFPRIRTEYGEIYLSLRIQSECGKMRTRNNSVFGHFSGCDKTEVIVSIHPPVNLCLRALQKLSFSWSAFYKYLETIRVMLCAIWYHLYTLKNMKNTRGVLNTFFTEHLNTSSNQRWCSQKRSDLDKTRNSNNKTQNTFKFKYT